MQYTKIKSCEWRFLQLAAELWKCNEFTRGDREREMLLMPVGPEIEYLEFIQ